MNSFVEIWLPLVAVSCLATLLAGLAIVCVLLRLPERRERFSQLFPKFSRTVAWCFAGPRWLLGRLRWRVRFSLRTLLVAMAIAGSALGWLATVARRVHQQRDAERRVESLGGTAHYDYRIHWPHSNGEPTPPGNFIVRAIVGDDAFARVTLVYFLKPIADAEFAVVKDLPDLRHVYVVGGRISSRGLEHLADLKKLSSLDLSDTTITAADVFRSPIGSRLEQLNFSGSSVSDATLAGLPRLKQLQGLQLESASITDAGLAPVANHAGLRHLNLYKCPGITDRGIILLGRLKNLRSLMIAGVSITDASLAVLDDLPHLEELQLFGVPLADESMRHLEGLTSMRRLILRSCQVTDAGMLQLGGMHDLEVLDLTGADVTDAGLATLAEFPRLEVLTLIGSKNQTDAAVSQLQKLTSLKTLLVGPGITRDGALKLAQVLPTCQVGHADATNNLQYLPPGGK